MSSSWSIKVGIAWCFALWQVMVSAAQAGVSVDQQFRHLSIEDGLSSNHTTCFYEDEQGFMWIGTNEGLCRFDGLHFQTYFQNPKDPAHSLSGNWINAMYACDNRLFITTNHGVSVFDIDRQEFCNDVLTDERYNYRSRELFNFMVLLNDKWYVGGENSLFELNRDFSFSYDLSAEMKNRNFSTMRDYLAPVLDPDGHLFFASCGDLVRYTPSSGQLLASSFLPEDSLMPTPLMCHTASPCFHGEGVLYFGWASNPLMIEKGFKKEIILRSANPVYDGSTNFCLVDDQNTMWFATESGLFWRSSDGVISEVILDGSTAMACYQVYQDARKNYWIATDGGVYYTEKHHSNWAIVPLPNVSQSKTVYAQDMVWWQNALWLNTNESVLPVIYKLDKGNLQSYTVKGLEKGVRSLYPWDDQHLLVGGWKYASMLQSGEFTSSPVEFIPEDYRAFPIIKTLRDSHKNTWFSFGQYNGVLRMNSDRSQFVHFLQKEALAAHERSIPISSAYDIAEDDDGAIWMVRSKLDGKVVCWNPTSDSFEEIHPVNPDAANMHYNGESYCIVAAKDAIWFAVMREGLFRYDRKTKTLEQFTRNDGLLSNDIYALEVDKRGVVWMGTAQGLAAMSYPGKTVTHFTTSNGLPDQNFSSASYYNASEDEMYFSANGFVIAFSPEALLRPTAIPELYLTGIRIDGRESGILPREFQPGENHIDFMYTAVDLYDAAGFEYRYRLEGLETDWNEAGKNKMASYANIPAGDYTLQVSVKTLGVWSEPRTLYSFHLPQYFYKTAWFYICLAALFCLIVFAVYKFRIRRIKQMEAIRNRISRDLHDDIGSALSSIRILSGQRKTTEEQNREALQRINRSSQQMLDNMDDIIWAIQPENDSGEQLLIRMREFASEVIEAAGMQYELQFDERIEQRHFALNQKRNVYLIFKEAVNNALKYAQANKVRIVFRLTTANRLELEISDNGVGFDADRPPQGNGLKNMQSRAEELNGKLKIHSHSGEGTRIQLQFDLNSHG